MPSLDGATARRAYTLDGVVSRQDRHPTPPWRVVIVKGLRQKDSVSVGAATARDLIAVTARRPGSVLVRPILRLLRLAEVEHIEEIADRRPVDRYVRVVATGDRVRKIVAAAVGERPPRSCSSLSTVRPEVRSSRAPGRRGMPTRAETLCSGRPDPGSCLDMVCFGTWNQIPRELSGRDHRWWLRRESGLGQWWAHRFDGRTRDQSWRRA